MCFPSADNTGLLLGLFTQTHWMLSLSQAKRFLSVLQALQAGLASGKAFAQKPGIAAGG